MKVCLVNLWDRSAMLHYCTQLANALAHFSDMEVSVVLPRSTPEHSLRLLDPKINRIALDVITETSLCQLVRMPWQLIQTPRAMAQIASAHPAVIHVTAAHVWQIIMLPWLARRYPIVSTLHDVTPHPGLDNTWRKRKEMKTLIDQSRAVFVHAETLKEALLARRPDLKATQVRVIPHGDYAFFTRWRTSCPVESATILFFGRIRAYKGLDDLLDAYQRVLQQRPDAKLIIAGEGPLDQWRPRLAALPSCEVHNRFIPDEEVSVFFERASIVACPYTEASQSGVIPVAYAFAKPVVASSVGGLPESVTDGVTGLLTPPHDPVALADALLRLLNDEALRTRLGQAGHHKMTTDLNWDMIATETIRIYRQVGAV
jgi:alpha-maltose-1-phosphate synthase